MPPNRIVGREGEQSEIERFLDAAGRHFSAAALEGEAGIGKTTLWRQARQRAEERGAEVLGVDPRAPRPSSRLRL